MRRTISLQGAVDYNNKSSRCLAATRQGSAASTGTGVLSTEYWVPSTGYRVLGTGTRRAPL